MIAIMHLSIIIPAFNEERLIEQCLQSVAASIAANSRPGFTSEVIVVDNNSTDKKAELARQAGAEVVFEPINQIGRARNTGAAQATGDWLLFLDADSLLNPGLLADILGMIESGKYVGCGSTLRMDGLPWWANLTLRLWTGTSILCGWAAGALVVCRRDAFQDDRGLFPIASTRTLEERWGGATLSGGAEERARSVIIRTLHTNECLLKHPNLRPNGRQRRMTTIRPSPGAYSSQMPLQSPP